MEVDQPNAAQKRWREAVREIGSVVSGGQAVIHHPVGRKGKHNKIEIGHWWVLPLTDAEHKSLHNGETFGHPSRKDFEKDAFEQVRQKLLDRTPPEDWIPSEACLAIMDYHR